MKKMLCVLSAGVMLATMMTGCGNTENSESTENSDKTVSEASTVEKTDEKTADENFVVYYPTEKNHKLEYVSAEISEDKADEINSLCEKVTAGTDKTVAYTYEESETSDTTATGGPVHFVEKLENGSMKEKIGLFSFRNPSAAEGDLQYTLQTPDSETINVYNCEDTEAYVNLCEILKEIILETDKDAVV